MKPTMNRPGSRPANPPPSAKRPAQATTTQRAASAARTQAFLAGIVSEMKRVTWPTREEWVTATLLTIGLVVTVGLYTYGVDKIFGWLFGLVTGQTR